jgi:hypothetical protein
MRGVYEYPVVSKLLKGPVPPNPDAIARAIARAHGWTIMPSGQTALNLLGLSTQVPAKWEYFSDGPSKTYKWSTADSSIGRPVSPDGPVTGAPTDRIAGTPGHGILAFKHRTNKEITNLSPKTALVVQALKALGEKNVTNTTLARLRQKRDAKDRKRAMREAKYVTAWVYEIIKRLADVERGE